MPFRSKQINFQLIASVMIILVLGAIILIYTQSILAPLAFGLLFSFLLKPVAAYLEKLTNSRIVSVSLTVAIAVIVLGTMISLFIMQIMTIARDLPTFSTSLSDFVRETRAWILQYANFLPGDSKSLVDDNISSIVTQPLTGLLKQIIASTGGFLNFLLLIIYTFFILLYRDSFNLFFIYQFKNEHQPKAKNFVKNVESIIQQYFYGTGTVIMILGTLNSVGLYFLDIDYAFFWGFMAAILAIIPYVGTIIGSFFPVVYALITGDSWIQPIGVIVLFIVIQTLEGNVITPKVVGNSVKINPLAAIIALFVGASIWGVAGMIMALPAIAIFKLICKQVDVLKPLSLLLSSELAKKDDKFIEEWNEERFRLSSLFTSKNKKPK